MIRHAPRGSHTSSPCRTRRFEPSFQPIPFFFVLAASGGRTRLTCGV